MVHLTYKNSQTAWEGLNEFFFNSSEEISEFLGGGRYGGQMTSYDFLIEIKRARVNPNFDFGNMFGYRPQKWSGLLKNYVDLHELKDLKNRVQEREMSKAKHYNLSMVFHNKHGHGKNCLLSLTVSRRQKHSRPVISFNMRSSEITKRLLMDLLLIERMGEYILGNNKFSIRMLATNIYQNAEAFTMYHNHKNLYDVLEIKANLDPDKWQKKVIGLLEKFLVCNVDDIKMKVHKRCVRQLQRPKGIPLSGDRPMLAKDLKLNI